jgi:hypothetical protein
VLRVLCIDIEAVFPSMVQEYLVQKLRNMKIDECLVKWILHFISNRSIKMVVDSQEGTKLVVNTGLLQGSPVLLVLFVIYIADIYQEIEEAIEG